MGKIRLEIGDNLLAGLFIILVAILCFVDCSVSQTTSTSPSEHDGVSFSISISSSSLK
mgnify:CR=1 FL=1